MDALLSAYAALTPRVPLEERHRFFSELHALYSAGVPVVGAIDDLREGTDSGRLRSALGRIGERLRTGIELQEAFALEPRVFDPLERALVRAGSVSGTLERTLGDLLEIQEDRLELGRLVRRTLAQPIVTLIFALFALEGVVLWMHGGSGEALQSFLEHTVLIAGIGFLGIVLTMAAISWLRTLPALHWLTDLLMAKTPFLSAVVFDASLASYLRVLSVLTASGVEIRERLAESARCIGNRYWSSRFGKLTPEVDQVPGFSFGSWSGVGFLPSGLARMLTSGERAGKLEEVSATAAREQLASASHRARGLATAALPLLTFPIVGVAIVLLEGRMILEIVDYFATPEVTEAFDQAMGELRKLTR